MSDCGSSPTKPETLQAASAGAGAQHAFEQGGTGRNRRAYQWMAGLARPAVSEVRTMDRIGACLTQAAACRARAESDPANRDRWMNEAIDWLERAIQPTGHVEVTFDASASSRRSKSAQTR